MSDWYKEVPKGRKENLQFRRDLIRLAATEPARRALREACALDLLFYVNAFVWTFDPRTKDKFLPFVTYPFQDNALLEIDACVEDGRDLVIEKSRDMGASWLSLVLMDWKWRFHDGYTFLMVSRKEDLVDAPGDPDSLFWKLDFVHQNLPGWLRPRTDRRRLHFGNLDTGSTIDGESTTSAAGVGGRRTAMFIDEFSRIEEGYQLLAGTADTTRCRIFNFTPFGTSNAAYQLSRRKDIRKLRLHWSEHPVKRRGLYRYDPVTKRVLILDESTEDERQTIWKSLWGEALQADFAPLRDGRLRSPWYDFECERRANEREIAQMLDIDYQGSQYQFFDPSLLTILQEQFACPPYWEGDVTYDEDTGRPDSFVRSPGGPLKLWLQLDGTGRPPVAGYGIGCDISTGSGATNSVISVVDSRTGEKVAEYASPYLRAEAMAMRAMALGWLFKDEHGEPAKLGWEVPGPGAMFGDTVLAASYPNCYYRESQMDGPKGKTSSRPGWHANNDTKRLLLEQYRSALASRQFINRSHAALEECKSFIHTPRGTVEHADESGSADPTGARVNHGDRVIADALSWKMVKSASRHSGDKKEAPAPVGSLAWRRGLSHNQGDEY